MYIQRQHTITSSFLMNPRRPFGNFSLWHLPRRVKNVCNEGSRFSSVLCLWSCETLLFNTKKSLIVSSEHQFVNHSQRYWFGFELIPSSINTGLLNICTAHLQRWRWLWFAWLLLYFVATAQAGRLPVDWLRELSKREEHGEGWYIIFVLYEWVTVLFRFQALSFKYMNS